MESNHQATNDREKIDANERPEFEGVRFVFSGGNISGQWSYWEELIERHGGIVSKSVSEETDYLVIDAGVELGERDSAQKHGVPAIEESGLRGLLNGVIPNLNLSQS